MILSGWEIAAFYLGWILAGGSPGPATMAIAGTAMQRGRKFSLAMACGILFGSACWGIAAALGVSAIMLSNAWLFEALRYAGASYLLFLAYKSLKSAAHAHSDLSARSVPGSAVRVFGKGALIHLTNPKAVLSWGAVYSLIMRPDAGLSEMLGAFAFLYSASLLVFIGYAFLFSSAPVVAAYARARPWFEALFAAFFGAASIKLITTRIEAG